MQSDFITSLLCVILCWVRGDTSHFHRDCHRTYDYIVHLLEGRTSLGISGLLIGLTTLPWMCWNSIFEFVYWRTVRENGLSPSMVTLDSIFQSACVHKEVQDHSGGQSNLDSYRLFVLVFLVYRSKVPLKKEGAGFRWKPTHGWVVIVGSIDS